MAAPSTSTLLNRLLTSGKFRHVQVLLKLSELGSIQRTAEAIGSTQPGVTQTLAYLEKLLETRLFDRHARGVRPTAVCLELLPAARTLLGALLDSAEVLSARGRGGSVLRLAGSISATDGLLLVALPEFSRRHPAIRIQLREAEGEDQLLAIARGEVDLVACRQPQVMPAGWEFLHLLDDQCAVVCAPGHALCSGKHKHKRARVSLATLAEQTWLLSPTGSLARNAFEELAARFARPPRTHPIETRAFNMTTHLLRAGEGVTLLPESIVRHLVDAGELALVALDDPIAVRPLGLLRPTAKLSEAAESLCAFLEAHVRNTPAAPRSGRGERRARA